MLKWMSEKINVAWYCSVYPLESYFFSSQNLMPFKKCDINVRDCPHGADDWLGIILFKLFCQEYEKF